MLHSLSFKNKIKMFATLCLMFLRCVQSPYLTLTTGQIRFFSEETLSPFIQCFSKRSNNPSPFEWTHSVWFTVNLTSCETIQNMADTGL